MSLKTGQPAILQNVWVTQRHFRCVHTSLSSPDLFVFTMS